MIKQLLTTTAVIAFAASAYAAEATPPVPARPLAVQAVQQPTSGGALASKLIGETVYSSNAEGAPTVGTINDLVVGPDGAIVAAIIGVGGFIGIGEKNVAVPFERITWSTAADGGAYAVLATTKEELQTAPEFDVSVYEPKAGPAPGNGQAMAPTAPQVPLAAAQQPQMDALRAIDPAAVTADDIKGVAVYTADNQNVGEISDVVITQDGKIDAAIIDVGGFLGIGEKPVAIAFEKVTLRKDAGGAIYAYTTLTQAEFDAATQYDKATYAKNRDTMRLGD